MAINTSVSITTASTPVITSQFKSLVLTNRGTAGIIWIRVGQTGDAVVGEGIPLNPGTATTVGGSIGIDRVGFFESPVTAISQTGTNILSVYYA